MVLSVWIGIFGLEASAQAVRPSQVLDALAASGSIFVQATSEESCPAKFRLEHSQLLPDGSQVGDKSYYMNAFAAGLNNANGFIHQGYHITYRPGLALNRTHRLFGGVDFPFGVAWNQAQQAESAKTLTYGYSATVVSPLMVVKIQGQIVFDAQTRSLTYFYRGTKIKDVTCVFSAQ